MNRIEAHKLRVVRGGHEILSVGHLGVADGEVLAVIGPNGAGKSTLVQCLALLDSCEGEVLLDGAPVRDRLAARRRLAVVFQDPLLLNTSAVANVTAGLQFRGLPRGKRDAIAMRWLERFGVGQLARRAARSLSGGEAQRVALARAFALSPDVLFLDEPFGALDAPTREQLLDDLDSVLEESNPATIFVTHDRDEALRLGDRVAVLIGGRLRQLGTGSEVFSSPVDPEVAEFVGVETIVPATVHFQDEGLTQLAAGRVMVYAAGDWAPGDHVLLCLRPEDITLAGEPQAVSSARNQLEGHVTRVTGAGRLVRVEIDCGFPLVSLVTRLSAQELELVPGKKVCAAFKASAAHVIRAHRPSDARTPAGARSETAGAS
ncbi:MAG: ABC transporter ATP-binding protein [Dehalococcoidia bacterium]